MADSYDLSHTTSKMEEFKRGDVESQAADADSIEVVEEEDPWALADVEDKSAPWKELTGKQKVGRVVWNYTLRPILLIFLTYMFICSLDFLSSGFKLLGGTTAGEIFSTSEFFNNPIACLMIGVFVTVLVQSSSTSTSIVVSMVGSNLLHVRSAIYIVMGANIGTSVTNTIVSIGQSGDRKQFRRAFAAATVHDMFNWLSVLVLLPIEAASGYLYRLSGLIVESMHLETNEGAKVEFLSALTKPFTHYVISVDTSIINKIALNETSANTSLIRIYCPDEISNQTRCHFMFMDVAGVWDDWVIGLIVFFIALFILCFCLVVIVKILNSIFSGHVANLLKKYVNSDFPGYGKYFTGYVAMFVGTILTILLNSSSIFTSALTPMVGVGVVTLDRMFPLTLGANIGTTFTSVLASLAQDSDSIAHSMQVSMCHLFFNISGIVLWYPIPFMRKLPIFLAKRLGSITSKYRWFAILYLIVLFFLMPAGVFGLSAAGTWVMAGVLIPVGLFIIIIIVINILQRRRPKALPTVLRTWDFLPLCCHSFKPIDRIISKLSTRCPCCKKKLDEDESTNVEEADGKSTTSKF